MKIRTSVVLSFVLVLVLLLADSVFSDSEVQKAYSQEKTAFSFPDGEQNQNFSSGLDHGTIASVPAGGDSSSMSAETGRADAVFAHPWFIILSALAAVAVLTGGTWLYFRKKMQTLDKMYRDVEEQERINTELQTANRIQNSMLPAQFPPFPEHTEIDIYAEMDPAREVGGDFYDFFLIDEDHLCMAIADVSGKGIPACLFMMVSKVILQSCARLGKSAAEILTKTNDALCEDNTAEMFVTIWLGILELSTGRLTAANAGHEYPVLKRADGKFELFKDKHGFVAGGLEGIRYKEYELTLKRGDKLFLYTDGLTEASDAEDRLFGTERMLEALNENPGGSPKEILNSVRRAVDRFVDDAEQFDDLTMMCVEYKG